MLEKIETALQNVDLEKLLTDYVIPGVTNVAIAIVIFLIGRIVAKSIVALVRRGMRQTKQDEMLIEFVASILGWVLLILVLVVSLSRLGLDTTSFVTILGAAGLAVGLALKDSLGNFAAGVMLILFRPFKAGDFVETAGTAGVVEEVRIFSTEMRTPDNQALTVPNSEIYSGVIKNVTARETRRIDFVFGIGYDDDFRVAKQIIADVFAKEERLLEEPAPFIALGELGDSSLNIFARPWVKTSEYFAVKCDLLEAIKIAFDEAGISIPYPQMDLHVNQIIEATEAS